MTTHVQTTHSDEKKFVCDVCGKAVKTKQALQHHLNSHQGTKVPIAVLLPPFPQFQSHWTVLYFVLPSSPSSVLIC